MSLSARLYIGDNLSSNYTKEYQVTQCEVKVARNHNLYRPDGNPRCSVANISLIAPDKDDLELFQWYIDQTSLSGKIVVDLTNQSAKYDITERTFKFEEAECFSIAEVYDINGTNRHLLKLGIMMKVVEIDEIPFQ
ncbi:type VI secretion system tube protein TssD [uncultured Bacteroides sp.]|uniref:type VI secretion system tube protein TssD n=1 Tax=uncultured Bacteroides sp. TaxID=162156 RepID=UPI002620C19C|nr:type VI secretion system tube protein TssD [uncultured Bacteroides sp.]